MLSEIREALPPPPPPPRKLNFRHWSQFYYSGIFRGNFFAGTDNIYPKYEQHHRVSKVLFVV